MASLEVKKVPGKRSTYRKVEKKGSAELDPSESGREEAVMKHCKSGKSLGPFLSCRYSGL